MSLIEYPSDDTCLLYLVRHGATEPNLMDPPIMQGKGIDSPLAGIGIEQAKRAANALSDRPLKACYCSPLTRAKQTAEIIAKPHSLIPESVKELVEAEVGDWEGKSWPEIMAAEPERYQAFREDPSKNGYPGGENLTDIHGRVTDTLNDLMQKHLGQEILVVAHSVVNRVYLGQLLGLTIAKGYYVQQLNCSINLVRYKAGKAKAVTINAVGHLM